MDRFFLLGRYRFIEKIGSGSFGDVWQAYDITTNSVVAIKSEKQENNQNMQLFHERNVYEAVSLAAIGPENEEQQQQYTGRSMTDSSSLVTAEGFPRIYGSTEAIHYNFLIMDFLGYNLEKLFEICGHRFSLRTVLNIADQLITRVESLHRASYVHRDIKPENFVIGISSTSATSEGGILTETDTKYPNKKDLIYMIDLGLAQRFREKSTDYHLPMRSNCTPTGNARFSSLNNHFGQEQSRRDDMEGIAYMLVYFLKGGSLPWMNVKAKTMQQRMKLVGQIKATTSIDAVCSGLPPEFATFLREIRQLRFDDEPDYDHYRKMFRELYDRECKDQPEKDINDDIYEWDWEKVEGYKPVVVPVLKKEVTPRLDSKKQREKAMSNPKPRPPTPLIAVPRLKPNRVLAAKGHGISRSSNLVYSPKVSGGNGATAGERNASSGGIPKSNH